MRRALRLVLALATAASTRSLDAQVLELQGGGSSLHSGYGGTVNVWGSGYEGYLALGYLDGIRVSAFAKRLVGRDTLRIGNDVVPVRLPTDLFSSGNAMLVQGLGVRRATRRTSVYAFAGTSASAVPAPFFTATNADGAVGVLQIERRLSPTLMLVSHALAAGRQTALQGVRWQSPSGLGAGVTAGVGANEPYAAASFNATQERYDVRASYVYFDAGFHRAGVPMPIQTEVERENVLVTLRPKSDLVLSVGRQHFRQDSVEPGSPDRATLNQLSGSYRFRGTNAASGIFDSHAGGDHTVSSFLSASRDLNRWLQSELYLLRVWSPSPAQSTTPVLYLREFLTPQLNLLQVVTHANDRTAVSFGGSFTSGLAAFGVDYRVVHTPYRPRDPFVQTVALNVRLQLGKYHLDVASFVTPDGRVHYTASGSTFMYVGQSAMGSVRPLELRFERYLVRGRVLDERGAPVEGAALEIGSEIVFSNSRGEFFLRLAGARPLAMRVALDEFLVPGRFEVVASPASATPEREDRARPVEVIIRRVVAPPPDGGPTGAASLGSPASPPPVP